MLPSEVNNVNVKDSLEFDRSGNAIKYQQFTFFIADHGPFVEKFYAGEQFPDAIARRIAARVEQLRSLGVIPGAGS